MRLTERFEAYEDSIFTELALLRTRLQQEGRSVVDLSIGSPDLPPPLHVRRALSEASLEEGQYRYAVKDESALLCAMADYYRDRFGVALNPAAEVSSMLGSQEGLAHIAMALLDPGDTVLVPDPGYPIFGIGPALCGMHVERVPQLQENGYLMDLEALPQDVVERARLLILSYPANPVTAVADAAYFERVVAFAKQHDLIVLHDNAYCELTFDGYRAGSFLQTPGATDVAVEFFSLSKTYNLAGARIAFALGNAQIIRHIRTLKSHFDFGMFLPLQQAALAALTGPQDCVEQTRAAYQRRRDVLLSGLESLGWRIEKPQATMFVWAPLPGGFEDARDFAWQLAQRSGVIVVPGTAFGPRGEGFVRLALVQTEEVLKQAVEQIRKSGVLSDAR